MTWEPFNALLGLPKLVDWQNGIRGEIHTQSDDESNHSSPENVYQCVACNKGGVLWCCESCDASYHEKCLSTQSKNGHQNQAGIWICDNCFAATKQICKANNI